MNFLCPCCISGREHVSIDYDKKTYSDVCRLFLFNMDMVKNHSQLLIS